MIDTHCHLYSAEFDLDREAVLARAISMGVKRIYLPAIDINSSENLSLLADKEPEICFAMAGLHPCSVKENFIDEIDHVKKLLRERRFAGIGETGLDFFWDKTFAAEQYQALEIQIELALEFKLPLILHTRNATKETIDVILKYKRRGLTGIFHCFGGTLEEADQIIAAGFYLGIGGVVTYKNAGLAEVLQSVDIDHLVLETDAPYLAPVPFRGKRNESSYLPYIVEKIALIKSMGINDVVDITTANAEKIFAV